MFSKVDELVTHFIVTYDGESAILPIQCVM